MEHWVSDATDESLNSTSETKKKKMVSGLTKPNVYNHHVYYETAAED